MSVRLTVQFGEIIIPDVYFAVAPVAGDNIAPTYFDINGKYRGSDVTTQLPGTGLLVVRERRFTQRHSLILWLKEVE